MPGHRDRSSTGSGGRRRGTPVARGVAAAGAIALAATIAHWAAPAQAALVTAAPRLLPGTGALTAGAGAPAAALAGGASSFRRIILPDLLIVAPAGLTSGQVERLGKITGVRNMITFDGAEIRAGGQPASVIGVNPAQFRSWVPLRTASDQAFWTALARSGFVASGSAKARLRLRVGHSYQLTAGTSRAVAFGAAAQLGLAGVDLLVNASTSRALGLVHRVAGLISAPGVDLATLTGKVRKILGPGGKMVSLRTEQLPAAPVRPGQLPSTYLALFKASAADYCPGMPWTVLAAIGQIESADGTNVGPSSAGALGPMQFLPSTWAQWGIDGFGQTGPPDVMNPYDAVPSAARMLCADGAASGGRALYSAIFAYNHADWYVNEVLALAAEYAAESR
jgi:Transglycosylase SLT domain